MKKTLILTGIGLLCAAGSTHAQTATERAAIAKTYNQSLLSDMAKQSELKAKAEKAAALDYAKRNNIPVFIKDKDGQVISELMRIDNNVPIYYTVKNVAAARSTRANQLNTGGAMGLALDGQNMMVSVWDGGAVRPTHQEFGNRVTIKDNAAAAGADHATHVGGTIGAAGVSPNAKGMATNVKLESYEWNNDKSEMTTAASQGLLMSNHSYGYRFDQLPSWYLGAYIDESKDWDNILFNAPYYVICKAAGNDGTATNSNAIGGGSSSAYDKLSGAATSKNVIVVANGQDASVNNAGELTSPLQINSSSSQGPTDDLRIKPDITANGTTLYSSIATSNTAYGTMTGTSMATPNTSGTLILVQQHYKNVTSGYMLGAALKGLALHTADEAGPVGPDAVFGWGLLNAKKMVETINNRNTTAMISDRTLNNGAKDSIVVTSDGVTPLTASISWYDRSGTVQTSSQINSATKRLVNDLDLRVKSLANNTQYLPWVLTSRSSNAQADNASDNYERVDVGVVPAGQYAILINHKGTLSGNSQNYTLIVTGKSNNVATCNPPNNLNTTNITTSGASLNFTASSSTNTGYTIEYKASNATQWTVAATGTGTSTNLSGLSAATTYNWRVKTNCSATESSAYADASFTTSGAAVCNAPTNLASSNITANSAGLSWTASTSANTGYTVEYKTTAATQWTSAGTTTATSTTLNNLSASTAYQYRVRTNCSSTSTSSDATGSFTTAANPSTSCAQAFEPNASISAAYTIVVNTNYEAAIGTSGDVDYYKITLPASTNTVSLTNLTHDVDLAIQNGSGQTLAVSENGGNASEQISGNFSGGTYYLKVYPYSGFNANSCYILRVSNNSATRLGNMGASIEESSPISAYPNPASNQLNVKISEKMAKDANIRVYDLLGKELINQKAGKTENQLDISGLPAGIYHIVVASGQNQYHIKFTKK